MKIEKHKIMLKNDIEINALAIRRLLISNQGELSIREIGEYTDFKEVMIVLSLGWLAKENAIEFRLKEEIIYVVLLSFQERFY